MEKLKFLFTITYFDALNKNFQFARPSNTSVIQRVLGPTDESSAIVAEKAYKEFFEGENPLIKVNDVGALTVLSIKDGDLSDSNEDSAADLPKDNKFYKIHHSHNTREVYDFLIKKINEAVRVVEVPQ